MKMEDQTYGKTCAIVALMRRETLDEKISELIEVFHSVCFYGGSSSL